MSTGEPAAYDRLDIYQTWNPSELKTAEAEVERLRAVLKDIETLCIHSKWSPIWKKVREGLNG